MADLLEGYGIARIKRERINADLVDQLNRLDKQLELDNKRDPITQTDVIDALAHGSIIVVAQFEGRIVAMGTISKVSRLRRSFCEIHDVVTDLHHRRRGLARLIMDDLFRQAKHHFRVPRVDLCTRPDNIEALALYKSLGFTERQTSPLRLVLS